MNLVDMATSSGNFHFVIQFIIILVKIAVVITVSLLHVMYATYFERKVIGHMQVRLRPMRTGPHGIWQPVADGLKSFLKRTLFLLERTSRYSCWPLYFCFRRDERPGGIPFSFGPMYVVANINVALLYVLAMSSLGAYGVS